MINELSTIDNTQAPAVALIREAIAAKADPAQLRELLAVRREWEADEARKAFNFAVSEFQKRAPIVAKEDQAHDKKYARMDRIWREIRPLLTDLGLSVTWQICELRDQLCHVEGQLRHRDGHGEKLVQDIPLPEIVRGQNRAQQMGSASTYARRYALCAALGIVTGDDDDGNAAGGNYVTDQQARQITELIDAARGIDGFNAGAFWKWAGAERAAEIRADRFTDIVAALNRKLSGQ